MVNELKNILLAGIGSAAYTYEKASGLIDEMVKKGKLTVNEGKDLTEELKRTMKNKTEDLKQKAEDFKPLTREDMVEVLKEMNFASKSEVEELNCRLSKIEEKLNDNM